MRHGARSEPTVKRRAVNKKRTLLRQLDLRQQDLDGIGRALLNDWAKAAAIVELYFDWADEHGWLDEDGSPPAFTATFLASVNTSRLTLVKLSEYLRRSGKAAPSLVAQLQAHARAGQGAGQVVPIGRTKP